MKRILIVTISLIFILFFIFGVVYIENNFKNTQDYDLGNEMSYEYLMKLNQNKNNFILDEEVAFNIGVLLLKEAFPNYLKDINKFEINVFNVGTENEVIWQISAREKENINFLGGGVYIQYKASGEIINFGFGE